MHNLNIASVVCLLLTLFLSEAALAQSPAICDVDSDGDVDRNDIALILAARNSSATGPGDVRDADGDGAITVLDARRCVALCTLTNCAALENAPPVADAGPDRTVMAGATVQLDGSGSSDIDSSLLSFQWSFVTLPPGSAAVLSNPNAITPSFIADMVGVYVVQLIVNDGLVDSEPDTVQITTENTPPVAAAGMDRTVELGETVILDGSGSTDVNGDLLSFAWSFVSIPSSSGAMLIDADQVMPFFVADAPGDYVVQLIVNDGLASSAPDTVTISTENVAPVADAGQDQPADLGETVVLDGSGSTDVDGDPLSFMWSFVTKPADSAAVLSDPTAVMPSFVVDVAGEYVAQLIVNDGLIDSLPDTVRVGTALSPVADAGPDQMVFVNQLVQLDGGNSFDPEGGPLQFNWSLVVVPPDSQAQLSDPAAVMPTFTADIEGNYEAQLIVTDEMMLDSSPDTVLISTEIPIPVADAGVDQADALVGNIVMLDGGGSSDPAGNPLTFNWALTVIPDGSEAFLLDSTTVTPSFEPDVRGVYMAQLIVNNGFLDSDPDTAMITTANRPPEAFNTQISPPPLLTDGNGGLVQSSVDLVGNAVDLDNDFLSYTWTLISKPTESMAQLLNADQSVASLQLDALGRYVVESVANDGDADSNTAEYAVQTRALLQCFDSPTSEGDFLVSVIGEAGETEIIEFQAPAPIDGASVFVDLFLFTEVLIVKGTLYDPSNNIVGSFTSNDMGAFFQLFEVGAYRVEVTANDGSSTGDYELSCFGFQGFPQ